LFAFVVLDLVSSVLSQEIGLEERLWNDLFCVKWDVEQVTECCLHACLLSVITHQLVVDVVRG